MYVYDFRAQTFCSDASPCRVTVMKSVYLLGASSTPTVVTTRYLQTLLNVSWETVYFLLRITGLDHSSQLGKSQLLLPCPTPTPLLILATFFLRVCVWVPI